MGATALMLLLGASIPGAGGQDKKEEKAMATGTWILMREGDKGNPGGDPVPAADQDVLTLKEDGTMTYLKKSREKTNTGKWELSADRKQLLIGGDDPSDREAMDILELSEKKLRLRTGPLVLTYEKQEPKK